MFFIIGAMLTSLLIYIASNNDFDKEFDPKASAYNDYRNKMNQYIKMYGEPGWQANLTFNAIKPLLDEKYSKKLIWNEGTNMLFFRPAPDEAAIPVMLEREDYEMLVNYNTKKHQLEKDNRAAETTIKVSEDIRKILRNEANFQTNLRELYAGKCGIEIPNATTLSVIRNAAGSDSSLVTMSEMKTIKEFCRAAIVYSFTEQAWDLIDAPEDMTIYDWYKLIEQTPDAESWFRKMFQGQV
jgi:hypothetical protein